METTTQQEKFEKLRKLNLETFQDRLLVLPDDGETRTAGGIIIPDTAKEKPKKGTVIYVGEKHPDDYGAFPKVGDRVVYGKYAGSEIEIEGIEIIIMRNSDLMFRFPANVNIRLTL